MKFSTVILALIPLVGVIARPCDQCDYRFPNLLASPAPLVKRDDGVLTFADAVVKGQQRMANMQAGVARGTDKVGGQASLNQFTENPAGNSQYAESANINYRNELKSFLGVDGTAATFYNVVLSTNQVPSKVFCDATYSPKTGVISADKTDKSVCNGVEMSDAMFWEYLRIAHTKSVHAEGIKGIVRHQITNSKTKGIIKEIYQREKKDSTKDDITIRPFTDEFYAVIGTPNGAVAAYMLGDYPQTIGKQTIGSIMIIGAKTNSMIIKYE